VTTVYKDETGGDRIPGTADFEELTYKNQNYENYNLDLFIFNNNDSELHATDY
jgi:hypothetical protein